MNIEAIPGYLIFFDNIRVDHLVKSFSCTISNDGSINRANIDMLALPEMDRVARYSEQNVLLGKEDAVENMTNVKIFIKNIFNGLYTLVFDGNIRSKTYVKSPGGNYLSYGIIDHMEGITKTIAPVAIPFTETTGLSQVEFRLRAQGIEAEKIQSLTSEGEVDFKGKTIQQILDILKAQALVHNKVYSDTQGVARWNNPVDRIRVIGDISDSLRDLDILDLRLGANNLNADNLYVIFNDILQKLMFEFFQDRDGWIKIKPPFWNEKIPLSHVIDASLIINSSVHTAWENMVTRVLSIGGIARSQERLMTNNISKSLFLPMGAYLGDINGGDGFWSTLFTNDQTTPQEKWGRTFKENETGIQWLDAAIKRIDTRWDPQRSSLMQIHVPVSTSVRHIGAKGTVVDITTGAAIHQTHVYVRLKEGPYKGFQVGYHGLQTIRARKGQEVKGGEEIGITSSLSGLLPTPEEEKVTGPRLSSFWLEVRHESAGIGNIYGQQFLQVERMNPLIYCRDSSVPTLNVPSFAIRKALGAKNLPNPTELEQKYGISVFETIQPLIKYANEEAFKNESAQETLRKYSAFMYNMANSVAKSASIQLVGAPWLRPGMNCLISPTDIDMVYYIASVAHSGDPQSGVSTSLSLIHGRTGEAFFFNPDSFGALKPVRDNIFINNISSNFLPENQFAGQVLHSGRDYLKLRDDLSKLHTDSEEQLLKADKVPILKDLYGKDKISDRTIQVSSKTPVGTVFDFVFDKDYSVEDIQKILDTIYSNAPAVVKNRKEKTKKASEMASKNAYRRFVSTQLEERR